MTLNDKIGNIIRDIHSLRFDQGHTEELPRNGQLYRR
jgi:hypothetical protein